MKFRGPFQSGRFDRQGRTDLGEEAFPFPATPMDLVQLAQRAATFVSYQPEPDTYDPVSSAYQPASPSYQPPASWFDGIPPASSTPPLHATPLPEPSHTAPAAVSADQMYEASLLSPELMQQILQAFSLDGVTPEPAHDLSEIAEAIFEQQMQQPIEPQALPELQEAYEQQLDRLLDVQMG